MFSLLNSLKADTFLNPIFLTQYLFHVSEDPCFLGYRFFRVQVYVLEVALKLIVALGLNLSLLCHDIYVCNVSSSLGINVRKYTHQIFMSPQSFSEFF